VVRHARQLDSRCVGSRTRPRNLLRPIDLRYVSFPISPYLRNIHETSCHGNLEYIIPLLFRITSFIRLLVFSHFFLFDWLFYLVFYWIGCSVSCLLLHWLFCLMSFIILVVLSHVFYYIGCSVSCLLLHWLFCLLSYLIGCSVSCLLLHWLFYLMSFI
jgi:hypothetical protein